MSITIQITPPHGLPQVLDPIGVAGAIGSNGWTPVLSIASDGARRVLQVVDWAGGEDTKPPVGQYVGSGSTLVSDIADAVDIRGTQGIQGPQGDPGQILTSGQIFTDDGPPDNSLGVDNDIYIDNLTADLYQKQSGAWVLQTNIKGAKGDKGDDGAAGSQGLAGANGSTILIGSGAPAGGLGAINDIYIESASFQLYRKTGASAWTTIGSMRGPAGATIRVAAGGPSNSLGADGDLYIDSASGDLFLRSAGTYSQTGNIKGPQGTQGIQGNPGAAGPAGASVLFGAGAPASGLGSNGDTYFDYSGFHFYTKAAGAWTDRGSVKGADGIGNAIYTGPSVPGTIPPSIDGDIFINTSNGDLYQKSGGVWGSPLMNIRGAAGAAGSPGPQGDPGVAGPAGNSILTGSGNPSGATGNNGDLYINTTSGDLFGPKTAGAWGGAVSNLKGPQGTQGIQGNPGNPGANGSNFLSGAGAPGSGLGANGDTYLNVTTGDLYGPKASGAWGGIQGNIRGIQGIQGIPGNTGAAGARGSVWYTGATTPPGAQSGQLDGDYYMVTGTGRIWKLVSGSWVDQGFAVAGPSGASGAPGTLWYTGTSRPTIPPALEGDLFLNTTNGNVDKVVGSAWSTILNIRGGRWYTSVGPPGGLLGQKDLDFCIDSTNGEIYVLVSGVWTDQGFSIKGATGAAGSAGVNGWTPSIAIVTDGARRVMQIVDWVGGTGTKPSTTNQFVGASGIVSTAAAAVDIRGSAGANGADGAAGPSNLPGISVSAARTITSADKGQCLFHPSADTTARTWTIDNTSSWAAASGSPAVGGGDTVSFLNANGAGVITIAVSGAGATLRQVGSTNTGNRSLAANGYAVAWRAPDNLTWYISGSGLT